MKIKRYIAYVLFFVSLLMLAVPVIPHHHHADGLLCMKNDIDTECCTHPVNKAGEHCCCNTGCIATHFFQQRPNLDVEFIQLLPGNILFNLTDLLSSPIFSSFIGHLRQESIYIESLHSTFLTRATGLRAPPFLLF